MIMGVKMPLIGRELIANQEDDRLYVRLENDDLVDITKLFGDFEFVPENRVLLLGPVTVE
jgi:hypothetical protein